MCCHGRVKVAQLRRISHCGNTVGLETVTITPVRHWFDPGQRHSPFTSVLGDAPADEHGVDNPPSPLNEHNGMIVHLNCHFLYYQDTFCRSLQHTGAKILSSSFVHGFPWCSGFHICLTRRRSPVRSRTETVLSTSLTAVNLNHCRGGSWRSCVYTYMF